MKKLLAVVALTIGLGLLAPASAQAQFAGQPYGYNTGGNPVPYWTVGYGFAAPGRQYTIQRFGYSIPGTNYNYGFYRMYTAGQGVSTGYYRGYSTPFYNNYQTYPLFASPSYFGSYSPTYVAPGYRYPAYYMPSY
jgi:hypothetical protein